MRWTIAFILFLVSMVAAHFLTIHLVSSLIMERAQVTMEERGVPLHQWVASPRQTPQTQAVVRPSPDLSYAVCRFDVRDGPVLISAPGWEGYGSLSIFNERTNNVFVADLNGEDASIILHRPKTQIDDIDLVGQSVEIEGWGIALIRRLAPSDEAHEVASDLVEGARCDIFEEN